MLDLPPSSGRTNGTPAISDRARNLAALAQDTTWDVLVIGGGATGLGIALDAASRGLKVALVEAHDFAKGTSSKATKLVHGGVRYLAQGHIALVKEALHERAVLLANAPHLVQPVPFVMPTYHFWESAMYGTGLRMYDALAASDRLPPTESLSKAQTEDLLPNVNRAGLRGGIRYWDAQFDDARLAIALARTAAQHGALAINYMAVTDLLHNSQGLVAGAHVRDAETGQQFTLQARCTINATGVWVDHIRQFDERDAEAAVTPMVSPSQGSHLVVERHFWPGNNALLVPKTSDGRVLFAVPWLGHVILGTTDHPRTDSPIDPMPTPADAGFILQEAARYLAHPPTKADVRSQWAGLRPLVRPVQATSQGNTKSLSREHTVHISAHGLVSVTGGKWTTYRAMAEDVIRQCQMANLIPVKLPSCQTTRLPLVGSPGASVSADRTHTLQQPPGLAQYGQEAAIVQALPGADQRVHCKTTLTEAMVRFAARHEYARTVEDVLGRRSRLLFLDAAQAIQAAPRVAEILAEELDHPVDTTAFLTLAAQYQLV
ncbi:glycerol-3-phosphate dehydrogenase/oxidase [Lampropedia puyangensis]|uniref:Glycerol-3-phosphate dehydrogenase/oxidase n=1 Tax=Lampropedia puyangensis TaxID=1330072 RepID=A0A4S8FBI0_9BURK|nr:glycerol-3-phosphate dehydrogenase/oxidase [Lampropedia puyangensis]THU05023.1 glycerol-3-phosphate dehydrogenase/oxidase [Lampropedia puyangensis]